MGLLNPERKIDDMAEPAEWLNNVGWELGHATGMIDVSQDIVEVDWDELLKRSVDLISLGRDYEKMAGVDNG